MYKFLITSLLLILIPHINFAQHINIDQKKLSFLNSQELVNIVFAEDSLLMIDDLYEMKAIQKMRLKITDHESVYKANDWILDYNKSKLEIWPNVFTAQLNEKLGDIKNAPQFELNNTDARYSMKVTPTWMYFGYDAGIMDRPAKVTLQIEFYETQKPGNVIFSTEISRAMAKYNKADGDGEGSGPSLNRMRKAFALAAYKFAKALERVVN